MLTTLRIKNLALVEDLTVEFQSGYNVITGETGAGKSILIGALQLVLGQRADRTLIRSGSDTCTVEAVFDTGNVPSTLISFLQENGIEPCEGNQLFLKRTVQVNGTNRQYVNGSPATLQMLADIGNWLVDFHGPHDHQSLLQVSKQLAILDAFGDLAKYRDKFVEILLKRAALEGRKTALVVDEKTYAQQVDLLRFQVSEITYAQLKAGEDEEIEQQYLRVNNASRLLELAQKAKDLLGEGEHNILAMAATLRRSLMEIHRLDPGTAPMLEQQEQVGEQLVELQRSLTHYADKVDLNPQRLHELTERLNLLNAIKRKYGSNLTEVIAFGDEAKRKLELMENREEQLERINADLLKIGAELRRAGNDLSAARKKVIPKLVKAASKHLSELGFKQSEFDITISSDWGAGSAPNEDDMNRLKTQLSSQGFDTVEFQFSPNPGEPLRPLRTIASSGEMARVMLALKTALAAEDEVPVLVFDEVDANVGGETATAVGTKMLQIAKRRQVLCITHLPAVAASASSHFVVSKEVKGGRTISNLALLKGYERINEIARMLGSQTEAAKRHARALLEAHDQME